jgi:hypothetical protein
MSKASNMSAPVGLFDAPYDLDRILDFWLSLPKAARDPWWPTTTCRPRPRATKPSVAASPAKS